MVSGKHHNRQILKETIKTPKQTTYRLLEKKRRQVNIRLSSKLINKFLTVSIKTKLFNFCSDRNSIQNNIL